MKIPEEVNIPTPDYSKQAIKQPDPHILTAFIIKEICYINAEVSKIK
jgi:hypothetical protein